MLIITHSNYTGMIFEANVLSKIGSIAGGGRYDGLCGENTKCVGFSLGIDRLLKVMILIEMGYELDFRNRTSGPINAILFDREHGTMWGGSSNYGEDYGIAW